MPELRKTLVNQADHKVKFHKWPERILVFLSPFDWLINAKLLGISETSTKMWVDGGMTDGWIICKIYFCWIDIRQNGKNHERITLIRRERLKHVNVWWFVCLFLINRMLLSWLSDCLLPKRLWNEWVCTQWLIVTENSMSEWKCLLIFALVFSFFFGDVCVLTVLLKLLH